MDTKPIDVTSLRTSLAGATVGALGVLSGQGAEAAEVEKLRHIDEVVTW